MPRRRQHPIMLDLGSVGGTAVVRVNGQQARVLWKEPYRIDIARFAKAGENHLEITVTHTWNNRLVGDQSGPLEARITRTNLASKFTASSPLLPSGLLGPVVLKHPVSITCDLR